MRTPTSFPNSPKDDIDEGQDIVIDGNGNLAFTGGTLSLGAQPLPATEVDLR